MSCGDYSPFPHLASRGDGGNRTEEAAPFWERLDSLIHTHKLLLAAESYELMLLVRALCVCERERGWGNQCYTAHMLVKSKPTQPQREVLVQKIQKEQSTKINRHDVSNPGNAAPPSRLGTMPVMPSAEHPRRKGFSRKGVGSHCGLHS